MFPPLSVIDIVFLSLYFLVFFSSIGVTIHCIVKWRSSTKKKQIKVPRHDFKPFDTIDIRKRRDDPRFNH